MTDDADIARVLMDLAQERGAGKTFCPSEAARRLAQDWRPLMPAIRRVAADMPLSATQKGRAVDSAKVKGPIRLGLRRGA
ncbi:DUF3253 domain-containing protein [Palleronia abyssalis]|uniref:DUF3253 domain-containing protein n=1 Tax=Palleronia abyssalis TaxID=1501240 RepID=A0A2R8BYK5_9RHOB|nr:DUF3253 domain-containing protein [Palleronia abyssalis]SPJ25209.1 hypothetical protein PAA8504_03059 [Palleronia abyssalis]